MAQRRRSGRKIDFTHWTGGRILAAALAAGTNGQTFMAAQHLPETLLRFRGNLLAYADGAQAPGGLAAVAVGLIKVPEGTGTTVLWSPVTDTDAPWIWYEQFGIGYEEYVTDAISAPGVSVFRSTIDSKAMRIQQNEELQVVVENFTLLSAISVNVLVSGRTLQLPKEILSSFR